jgi:serine/threonine-protein kinase
MDCPNCHQPLREGALFCTRCGARTNPSRPDASAPTVEQLVSPTVVARDPLIGRELDGKYKIVAPLGEGGMGAVYRARRLMIGDEVALKVLHSKFTNDQSLVERFRREARAAAQLHHPNVVTIHDYGEARGPEGFAYIVMELVSGESLRDLLTREGKLDTARAVSLMREICAGVGAAHRRGIVHRDIKPDNIIVVPPDEDSAEERVKVVDFGIAKLRDMAHDGTLTQAGAMVGTPFYMSPEQCKGEPLDARADVYSLGALLYEMLAGTPPFVAHSLTGVVLKHINDPPPPLPRELHVPPALEAAITRSLSKDPEARQRDANEFAREIQAALSTPAAPSETKVAEPTFPATSQPAQVVPVSPAPLPPTTATGAQANQTPQPQAQQAYNQSAPPFPAQQPYAAQPPRKSRAPLVIGLLVVALVGLVGLGALAFILLASATSLGDDPNANANVRANANVARTPAPSNANSPNANSFGSNAGATPTPGATDQAQRAEQKILADSRVSAEDLAGLSTAQLRALRNTVYARHGRVFQTPDLQQYFQGRPWYRPRSDYSDTMLTANDRANAELIQTLENSGGQTQTADNAAVGKQVAATLEQWAATLNSGDLDAHMGFYADTLDTYYNRRGVPAAQVRADLERALDLYDTVDVQVSDVRVTPDSTGTHAVAIFDKTWDFDGGDGKRSSGKVQQQFMLAKSGGRWLITGEQDLKVYYKTGQ